MPDQATLWLNEYGLMLAIAILIVAAQFVIFAEMVMAAPELPWHD